MVDEMPDEADNEITRIVRRPGPKVLPVSIMAPPPAADAASVAPPVTPPAATPRAPANDLAPHVVPPVVSQTVSPAVSPMASQATPVTPPPAGPSVAAPPVTLDRSRPMMTPPMRPASPPPPGIAPQVKPQAVPAAAGPVPAPVAAPVIPSAAIDVPKPAPQPVPAAAPVAPAVHAVDVPKPVANAPAAVASIEPVVGWLVVVKGPGRGASRTLVTGRNSLGRGPDEDIRVDFGDTAIASHGHLYVVYDEEAREFVVEDGKQKVVVRLNGKLLTETMPIGHGDELRIGATTFRFVALCGPEFDWHEPQPDERPGTGEIVSDAPAVSANETTNEAEA